jgi:hypothetical protein
MQFWTEKEEEELLEALNNKISLHEFAKQTSRSIESVEFRLQKIIYDNIFRKNHSIKYVSSIINIPIDEIKRHYSIHKKYEEDERSRDKEKHITNNTTNKSDLDVFDRKMEKLEKENKFIKLVLENIELHKRLSDQIEKNNVSENIKNIIDSIRKK